MVVNLSPDALAPEARASVHDVLTALQALERRLRQRAARQLPGSRVASRAERVVLRRLADAPSPLSLVALASRVQRDVSSVCVLVQHLHIRGLLHKRADPRDGRRLQLSVTRAGRRIAHERPEGTEGGTSGELADALADWPEGRRQAALELLTQLTEVLATTGHTAPAPKP